PHPPTARYTISLHDALPISKSAKANVNLSTADFALDHYVAVTIEGESAGVEQLFAADFSQKANLATNGRSAVVNFFKKQKGEKLDRKSTRLNCSHVKISYAV